MYEHVKEMGNKHLVKNGDKPDASKTMEVKASAEKVPARDKAETRCHYENSGNCRDQDKCAYYHPKKTCQTQSKLGSCPQESLCEHRHPHRVCPRLQSTGYCASGDRCRNRHPLEYALSDYSQSTRRNGKYIHNNFNRNFLGSSPHSLQGPGVDQAYTGTRASLVRQESRGHPPSSLV